MLLNHLLILVILGIIQGIAEFIPISSSGHLVLAGQITSFKNGLDDIGAGSFLLINVALHIATLASVILYMRDDILMLIKGFFSGLVQWDIRKKEVQIGIRVLVASIPAGCIGFMLHDALEGLFSSLSAVLVLLIINGIILVSTKIIPTNDRSLEQIGIARTLVVGFCQAVAILPGISRSGMTIAGGMLMGLAPMESARFSFLMAIPVIIGAGLNEGIRAVHNTFPAEMAPALGIAMAVTMGIGLLSLKILFALVKKIRIHIFGYYTIALGLAGLIALSLMR